MPPYKTFFYAALSFLLGVLFASVKLGWGILVLQSAVVFSCVILWYVRKDREFAYIALLSLFLLAGAAYCGWYDAETEPAGVPFGEQVSFAGTVADDPIEKDSSQDLVVAVAEPFAARVLVRTARYPEIPYGARIALVGTLEKPVPEGYRNYLEKDGIYAIVRYPQISVVGKEIGLPSERVLLSVKHFATDAFARVLPGESAAFLGGITLGERAEFSDGFKAAMSASGTTHLVALSGYNISILVDAVLALLVGLFRRNVAYAFAVLIIVGFVAMTGAEASVVRAALMASIVLFGKHMGRTHDKRNLLLFAALVMVFANPKVLAFDIGFELSFLALFGIVFLKEAVHDAWNVTRAKGFFSWRENLLTTAAAQAMVAPLLIAQFGFFSLTSLAANVAILELIPLTMALGFALAGASALSYYAALALAWVTHFFLAAETGIIWFFSHLSVPISVNGGFAFTALYYAVIAGLLAYAAKKRRAALAMSFSSPSIVAGPHYE